MMKQFKVKVRAWAGMDFVKLAGQIKMIATSIHIGKREEIIKDLAGLIDGNAKEEIKQVFAAADADKEIVFEHVFNDITVHVTHATNVDWLYRDYSNAHMMKWKKIGPNCIEKYPKETTDLIVKRKKEAERRAEEDHKKWQAEQDSKKKGLIEKIKDIEFAARSPKKLEAYRSKNTDPYGGAVIAYAETWARLMQYEIKRREIAMITAQELNKFANEASGEADIEGITGFMYGMAVKVLADTWVHGEALRKWHNKQFDHDGDGVINPAVLTLTTKE